jgi:MarR family transcriptional regulator, organic hydroperoxide resistance regulator
LRAVYHFERTLYARFDIGYQEICLLQLLRRRGGLRVGDAARTLEMPLFSATRLVQRLEADGYVVKANDTVDRRAVLLDLTAKGRRFIRRIEDANYDLIARNAASLSREELKAFVMVAERIDGILGVSNSASEGLDQG